MTKFDRFQRLAALFVNRRIMALFLSHYILILALLLLNVPEMGIMNCCRFPIDSQCSHKTIYSGIAKNNIHFLGGNKYRAKWFGVAIMCVNIGSFRSNRTGNALFRVFMRPIGECESPSVWANQPYRETKQSLGSRSGDCRQYKNKAMRARQSQLGHSRDSSAPIKTARVLAMRIVMNAIKISGFYTVAKISYL